MVHPSGAYSASASPARSVHVLRSGQPGHTASSAAPASRVSRSLLVRSRLGTCSAPTRLQHRAHALQLYLTHKDLNQKTCVKSHSRILQKLL